MPDYPTLHAFLKAASAARHDQTESAMGNIGMGDEREYISFLRVQATAITALESALATYREQFAKAGISWANRSGAVIDDLAALSSTFEPMTAPVLPSFDHALGAAYTVEGSRLGNAMLFRHLQTASPDLAKCASSFLGFPTESGFWRNFMDKMNAEAIEEARWPNILAGSMLAFDVFQQSAQLEMSVRAKADL